VLSNPDFMNGNYNTHFIQNHDLSPEVVTPYSENILEFVTIASTLFVWSVNRYCREPEEGAGGGSGGGTGWR
jgi:hypothetical protein